MTTNANRRTFLKVLGGSTAAALAAAPLMKAIADPSSGDDDYFLFIHAAGGWDVTLWSDPRNEKKGLVDPATTANTDTGGLKRWKDKPFEGEDSTFEIVQPSGCKIPFGPGIGDLVELADRVCLVNGLAMNTVSHPDGTVFSATGRHTQGGRVEASSVDTMIANELGREQIFPLVSVNFPSYFVDDGRATLDRRVVPLRVGAIDAITRTLARSEASETSEDRAEVTALLSQEAKDLAAKSTYPDVLQGMALQYQSLERMLGGKLQTVFSAKHLRDTHPEFDFKARRIGQTAIAAAFAIEAMERNLVRCTSFAVSGFDTHVASNYKFQATLQQDLFDLVAALVRSLDKRPHPTKSGKKLSDHTHLLVVSEFCRTPMINVGGGRDHYPNNSALVISPRFKGNFVFGKSDADQLLPAQAGTFTDGARALGPPDLLATFVSAFGIDPRKYLRDGEVVKELLRA
jgi:uncharacterized protein (DUF1501 family)